jgi:hypothetical protein
LSGEIGLVHRLRLLSLSGNLMSPLLLADVTQTYPRPAPLGGFFYALGGNLFGDAEMLFDRGDAFERMIDFLREACAARALFFEPLYAAMDCGEFGRDISQTIIGRAELRIDVLELVNHFRFDAIDLFICRFDVGRYGSEAAFDR